MSVHPTCGALCIDEAIYALWEACEFSYTCLCNSDSQSEQNAFDSCVNGVCDAADIASWKQWGTEQCAPYVVASATGSPQVTAVTSAAVGSKGAPQGTAVVISTVVASKGGSLTGAASSFFGLSIPASTNGFATLINPTPASTNVPANPAIAPTSTPISQSTSSGGLSTGAVAGIAAGVAAVVLIAVALGFLLGRQRRSRSKATPPETMPGEEGKPEEGQAEIFEKPDSPITITKTPTNINHLPEQLEKSAGFDPRYGGRGPGPERGQDRRLTEIDSVYRPSPAPAYAEVAAMVPSEVDASAHLAGEYPMPHQSRVEADSTNHRPNEQTYPVPNTVYYELQASHNIQSSYASAPEWGPQPGPISSNPTPTAGAAAPQELWSPYSAHELTPLTANTPKPPS